MKGKIIVELDSEEYGELMDHLGSIYGMGERIAERDKMDVMSIQIMQRINLIEAILNNHAEVCP